MDGGTAVPRRPRRFTEPLAHSYGALTNCRSGQCLFTQGSACCMTDSADSNVRSLAANTGADSQVVSTGARTGRRNTSGEVSTSASSMSPANTACFHC